MSTSTATLNNNNDISLQTEQNDTLPRLESTSSRLGVSMRIENDITLDEESLTGGHVVNSGNINFGCHSNPSASVVVIPENTHHVHNFEMKRKATNVYYDDDEHFHEKRLKFPDEEDDEDDEDDDEDDDYDDELS